MILSSLLFDQMNMGWGENEEEVVLSTKKSQNLQAQKDDILGTYTQEDRSNIWPGLYFRRRDSHRLGDPLEI